MLKLFYENDIYTKVTTRISGRSLSPSPWSLSFGLIPARTSRHDAGLPLVEGNPELTSSPLNMHYSLSEVQLSDLHVNPAVRNDRGYASDINEAINAPLGKQSLFALHHTDDLSGAASESGDGAPSRPHRWTPPPPNHSRASSEASSDSGSDSSPCSPPVSWPAPPPPQSHGRSRFPRSPVNIPFSSSGALPDPAMTAETKGFQLCH